MRKIPALSRFLSVFLTVGLGLPQSALALRPAGLEEADQRLKEEVLQALGTSPAGLEEEEETPQKWVEKRLDELEDPAGLVADVAAFEIYHELSRPTDPVRFGELVHHGQRLVEALERNLNHPTKEIYQWVFGRILAFVAQNDRLRPFLQQLTPKVIEEVSPLDEQLLLRVHDLLMKDPMALGREISSRRQREALNQLLNILGILFLRGKDASPFLLQLLADLDSWEKEFSSEQSWRILRWLAVHTTARVPREGLDPFRVFIQAASRDSLYWRARLWALQGAGRVAKSDAKKLARVVQEISRLWEVLPNLLTGENLTRAQAHLKGIARRLSNEGSQAATQWLERMPFPSDFPWHRRGDRFGRFGGTAELEEPDLSLNAAQKALWNLLRNRIHRKTWEQRAAAEARTRKISPGREDFYWEDDVAWLVAEFASDSEVTLFDDSRLGLRIVRSAHTRFHPDFRAEVLFPLFTLDATIRPGYWSQEQVESVIGKGRGPHAFYWKDWPSQIEIVPDPEGNFSLRVWSDLASRFPQEVELLAAIAARLLQVPPYPVLVELLSDDNPYTRNWAMLVLASHPEASDDLLNRLIDFVSPEWNVSLPVKEELLRRIGRRDLVGWPLPLRRKLLDTVEPLLVDTQEKEQRRSVQQGEDSEVGLRLEATRLLAQLTLSDLVISELTFPVWEGVVLHEPNGQVQKEALQVYSRLYTERKRLEKVIVQLTEEADRQQLTPSGLLGRMTLGETGSPSHFERETVVLKSRRLEEGVGMEVSVEPDRWNPVRLAAVIPRLPHLFMQRGEWSAQVPLTYDSTTYKPWILVEAMVDPEGELNLRSSPVAEGELWEVFQAMARLALRVSTLADGGSTAGLEEPSVPGQGKEEDKVWPGRVKFTIRRGQKVQRTLPTGERITFHFDRKGRLMVLQPQGWIHYRGSSLQEGGGWEHTLWKTKVKILPLKRDGRHEEYWKSVTPQGLYLLPVEMVGKLLEGNAPPAEWRVSSPYVFRLVSQNDGPEVDVEILYREPMTEFPNGELTTGLEEGILQPEVFLERFGSRLTPQQWGEIPRGFRGALLLERVSFYTEGPGLTGGLEEIFRKRLPLGAPVAVFQIPLRPGEGFQSPGLILDDKALAEIWANPLNLPVLEVWLADLEALNPEAVIRMALRDFLDPSVKLLGIMVVEGRTLVAFV